MENENNFISEKLYANDCFEDYDYDGLDNDMEEDLILIDDDELAEAFERGELDEFEIA